MREDAAPPSATQAVRHPPIACSLEADGRLERTIEFARLLAGTLVAREDIQGGLRLRFRADPGVEPELREFIEREQACCAFFDFSLRPVTGEDAAVGHVELVVRAPAEARPFIDALFRPLAGRRILVTRPSGQAAEMVSALERLGAEPVIRSAIDIRPLEDASGIDDALRRLRTYDWVVFTSRNGVRHVWDRFEALGGGLERALEYGEAGRSRDRPRVAAIGPGTAAALELRGVRADYVPSEYVAEALAKGLPDVSGARLLLLRADIARSALPNLLRERGAEVEDVAAYRTVPAGEEGASGQGAAAPGGPAESGHLDAVTFTSPSTVRGFLRAEGRLPEGTAVVCIGPVTARAAREAGVHVDAIAESYTIPGLVEALVRLLAQRPGDPAGETSASGAGQETASR